MSINNRLFVRKQETRLGNQVEEVFVPSAQAKLLCDNFVYLANEFYLDYLEIESSLNNTRNREDALVAFEVFAFFHYLLEQALFESSQVPETYDQLLYICQSYVFVRFKKLGHISVLRHALILRQDCYRHYQLKQDSSEPHICFTEHIDSPLLKLLEMPVEISDDAIKFTQVHKYDAFTASQKQQMVSMLTLGYVKSFCKVLSSSFLGNSDFGLTDAHQFQLKIDKIIAQLDLEK